MGFHWAVIGPHHLRHNVTVGELRAPQVLVYKDVVDAGAVVCLAGTDHRVPTGIRFSAAGVEISERVYEDPTRTAFGVVLRNCGICFVRLVVLSWLLCL